ncbi:MAG: hypothetical protein ACTSRP_21635 [Candidatus Helarchaeota archaeon]
MRKKVLMFLIVILILITFGISKASATSTQWFPTAGTKSDYTISYILYLQNGTRIETSEFDLYNVSNIINTQITFRYSYSEYSSTTLKRTMQILAGNQVFSVDFYVYYYEDSSLSCSCYRIFPAVEDTVDKNNFWTYFTPGQFPDYFDCSLGPGSPVYKNEYNITSISKDQIIITNIYDQTYFTCETLIASRDGRVHSLSSTFIVDSYKSRGVFSTCITLNLIESEFTTTETIPNSPLIVTIGALALAILLIRLELKPKKRLSSI